MNGKDFFTVEAAAIGFSQDGGGEEEFEGGAKRKALVETMAENATGARIENRNAEAAAGFRFEIRKEIALRSERHQQGTPGT